MDQPIANDVRNPEIDGVLASIIHRVHGLNAVLISTGDGVPLVQVVGGSDTADADASAAASSESQAEQLAYFQAVSYTHLTLPTIYSV